jgi:pilus assembly protein TadC
MPTDEERRAELTSIGTALDYLRRRVEAIDGSMLAFLIAQAMDESRAQAITREG